jgi:hypothetical protein
MAWKLRENRRRSRGLKVPWQIKPFRKKSRHLSSHVDAVIAKNERTGFGINSCVFLGPFAEAQGLRVNS